MITFEEFKKLDIRIGRIVIAEKITGADKLLKLTVDLGTEQRQIVAGIAEFYDSNALIGKEVPILINLEPRTFKGVESQGMMLAADMDGKPVLLNPEKNVPLGSIIK